MAILKQNENQNSTFLGWYGKCGEPECKEFDLTQISGIEKVYQFTEDGLGIRAYVSGDKVRPYMQSFSKLVCGNIYWIVLKKGNSTITIPEFTHGYKSGAKNFGMISSDCSPVTTRPYDDNEPDDKDKDYDKPVKPCTKDVRICPDGSAVGRDGANDCKFPPCFFDKSDYLYAKEKWKLKQLTHYQFNFAWSCFCTEEATQQVTITVKYGRVIRIKKITNNEEISLNQNEGIETSPSRPPVPFKYLSVEGLFRWMDSELKKSPYSITASYDSEYGYIKSAFVDRIQEMADEEMGFSITAFEELPIEDSKCPPDYKKCADGTLLKRDPNNNCKFPECPDVPDDPIDKEIPKLKMRWLKKGSRSVLQIANALNPWSNGDADRKYLSWRTVYGSRVVNPREVNSDYWSPLKVEYTYSSEYGSSFDYDDIEMSIDENDHQIMISLGDSAEFLPDPAEIETTSHLYLFRGDYAHSIHKSYTYPVVVKSTDSIKGVLGCPEDAKICADGTVVVRNPDNNCEFDDCPSGEFIAEETPFSIEFGEGDFDQDFANDLNPTPTPTPTSTHGTIWATPTSSAGFVGGDSTPTSTYGTIWSTPTPTSSAQFVGDTSTPTPEMNTNLCPDDVMICPNGDVVGRDPDNNCSFFPCP